MGKESDFKQALFEWKERIVGIAPNIEDKSLSVIRGCSQPQFLLREIDTNQKMIRGGRIFELYIGQPFKRGQDSERILYTFPNDIARTIIHVLPTNGIIYERYAESDDSGRVFGLRFKPFYAKGKLIKLEIERGWLSGNDVKALLKFLGIDASKELVGCLDQDFHFMDTIISPERTRIEMFTRINDKYFNFVIDSQGFMEGQYSDFSGPITDNSEGVYDNLRNHILDCFLGINKFSFDLLESSIKYPKVLDSLRWLREFNIADNYLFSSVIVENKGSNVSLSIYGNSYRTFLDIDPENETFKACYYADSGKRYLAYEFKDGIVSLEIELGGIEEMDELLDGIGVSINNQKLISSIDAILSTGFKGLILKIWPGTNDRFQLKAKKEDSVKDNIIFEFRDGQVVKYDVEICTSDIELISTLVNVIKPEITLEDLKRNVATNTKNGLSLEGLTIEWGYHRIISRWRLDFKLLEREKKNEEKDPLLLPRE